VFSAKALRKAFQALEPTLGRGNIDALIHDLEMYGLPLVNERQEYSLAEIKVAIEKIFGEAAPLFTERLVRALNAVTE
jgi:hypothetical protein